MQKKQKMITGYLCISPWLIGFLTLTLGPLVYSIYVSLTEYSLLSPPIYVGLANYETALFYDDLFWKSLWNTIYFTGLSLPLGIVGSLLLAVLLNQKVRGQAVFRTLYYIPSITPIVATTLIWTWLLRSNHGLVNQLLFQFGIQGPRWLGSSAWAIPSLVLITFWASVGGSRAIIFLAGLQSIDVGLYEAAHIDGANAIQSFWIITLPMLSPTILFNMVIGVISSFQVFAVAFIATNGGPANATLFYVLHLYRSAFEWFQVGYGAALAWLLFVLMFVLTIFQFKLSSRWVYYVGE